MSEKDVFVKSLLEVWIRPTPLAFVQKRRLRIWVVGLWSSRGLAAQIEDMKVVLMALGQELATLGGGVPIGRLEAARGEAHGDDSVIDIGQIQVVLALLQPALLFGHCD